MSNKMRFSLVAAALALTCLVGGPARGGMVIDQQNTVTNGATSSSSSSLNSVSLGQSFTAGLGLIDFATFNLASSQAGSTYAVVLYSGSGYGGTVLATSNSPTIAVGGFGSQQAVEFDFATQVTLMVGNLYTLRITELTSAGGSVSILGSASNQNPYAFGNAFTGPGSPLPLTDFVFAEGYTTPNAVPEPSSIVLCAIAGLGGLGYQIRRRRRASNP